MFAIIGSGTCGKDGDNVTWTLNDDGTLVISGTGDMKEYVSIYDVPWRNIKDKINMATIDNGITSVGRIAFYECTKLKSISIPNSVTSIGDGTFSGCI